MYRYRRFPLRSKTRSFVETYQDKEKASEASPLQVNCTACYSLRTLNGSQSPGNQGSAVNTVHPNNLQQPWIPVALHNIPHQRKEIPKEHKSGAETIKEISYNAKFENISTSSVDTVVTINLSSNVWKKFANKPIAKSIVGNLIEYLSFASCCLVFCFVSVLPH